MKTLDEMIERYQMVAGQLTERARSYYVRGDEISREAKLAQAKVEALMEAKAALGEDEAKPKVRQRNRMLSGPWQRIMRRMYDLDRSFSYDDLSAAADDIEHDVGRDTLRSQMSGYKTGGLVQAHGDGLFSLTEAGLIAAGISDDASADESGADAPKQNEPPEGGSDVDRGGVRTAPPVSGFKLFPSVGSRRE